MTLASLKEETSHMIVFRNYSLSSSIPSILQINWQSKLARFVLKRRKKTKKISSEERGRDRKGLVIGPVKSKMTFLLTHCISFTFPLVICHVSLNHFSSFSWFLGVAVHLDTKLFKSMCAMFQCVKCLFEGQSQRSRQRKFDITRQLHASDR